MSLSCFSSFTCFFFTFTLGLFPYLPFTITYFSIHWLLAINSSALLLDPSSPFLTFFIRYWIWLIDTSTLRVSVFISCLYSFLRCLFHGAAKAVPHLPLILSSLWLILHSPVLFFPLGVHRCWCWYKFISTGCANSWCRADKSRCSNSQLVNRISTQDRKLQHFVQD